MSATPRITRTYIASMRTPAAYAVGGGASGRDRARVSTSRMGDGGQAGAIGAGSHPPSGTGETVSKEQGRDHQRKELSTGVINREHTGGRANACTDRGSGAVTTGTSVNGTPMTRDLRMRVKHLPDKEKDRCANTGLLQEVSLVVTVGIRSDRRQTA
jgi:hypothetical protein